MNSDRGYVYPSDKSCGLTLRQHFAGLAMTKFLDKYTMADASDLAFIAKKAFMMADAMLAENAGEGYDAMKRAEQNRNMAPNAVRD